MERRPLKDRHGVHHPLQKTARLRSTPGRPANASPLANVSTVEPPASNFSEREGETRLSTDISWRGIKSHVVKAAAKRSAHLCIHQHSQGLSLRPSPSPRAHHATAGPCLPYARGPSSSAHIRTAPARHPPRRQPGGTSTSPVKGSTVWGCFSRPPARLSH